MSRVIRIGDHINGWKDVICADLPDMFYAPLGGDTWTRLCHLSRRVNGRFFREFGPSMTPKRQLFLERLRGKISDWKASFMAKSEADSIAWMRSHAR